MDSRKKKKGVQVGKVNSDSYVKNKGRATSGADADGLAKALAAPFRPDRSPAPPDAHTDPTLILIPNWDLFRYYCFKHNIPRRNARIVLNEGIVRKHLYAKRVIVVMGDDRGSWVFDKSQQFAELAVQYYSNEMGYFQANYVTMNECPFDHCQKQQQSG